MQEEPEFDDETNITLDSLETSPNTTEINTESINLEDSPVLKGINDKIFKFNKWQDKWAMGVFATHLFVVILLLISGGVTGFFLQYLPNNHQDHQPGDDFNTPHNSTDTKYNPYDDLFDYFTNTMSLKEIARMIVATIICAIVGAIISFIWLLLNLKFARGMVYMCLIFSVIICIFISIFYFTIGGWILGSSLVIVNFIFFMCFFLWWKRMPFSAILSTAVAQLLLEIRTIIFATIFVIIIYTLWFLVWAIAILLIQQFANISIFLVIFPFLFLLFSWYWTVQVFKGIIHVMVAGMVGVWYFDMHENLMILSLVRTSITLNLGSICFASLLVPPLHFMRFTSLKVANFLSAIKRCSSISQQYALVVEVILTLFHLFNAYGFSEFSIFGKNFITASRSGLSLFLSYGIEKIILDSLIWNLAGLGAIIAAVITGVIASFGAWLLGSHYFFLVFLIAALLASSEFILLSEIFYAACNSLFLCACHSDSNKLQKRFPELIAAIKELYPSCTLVG